MVNLSIVRGEVGNAEGVDMEFRSPQSDSYSAIANLPQTPTKVLIGHAGDYENSVQIPMKDTKLADAEQGSKRVTVFSPVSPPNSESSASLRTEKLNDGPLDQREFNKSQSGFGSAVANVPAPGFTRATNRPYKKLGLQERPLLMDTPSLEGSASYTSSPQSEESASVVNSCRPTGPTASSFEPHSAASGQKGRSDTDQIATFETIDDIMDVNPYLRRADEIGIRHQVPGIGHLGSSLVPRGWTEGDPPITPDEAKKLFDIDRQKAVRDLDSSLANQNHLNDEERENFAAKIDHQWKARLLLYQTVLNERLLIYKEYHERQRRKMDCLRGDEQGLSRNRLSEVPQPIQPRAMTSYMPAPQLESPYWRRTSNCSEQMDSRFENRRTPQDARSWQSHTGLERNLNAIDRNHVSTSMRSAHIHYPTYNPEIARQALEDQQHTNAFTSVYKPCGAQEQLSQGALSSSIGVRPSVCFEANHVWTPQHNSPPEQGSTAQVRYDPFPYNSYSNFGSLGLENPQVRSAGFEENPLPCPVPYQPIQSGYGGSTNTNIYHGAYDPALQGHPYEKPLNMKSRTEFLPSRDRSAGGQNLLKNSHYETNKTGYSTNSSPHIPEHGGLSRHEPSSQTEDGQREDATALPRDFHLAQQSDHKATASKPTLDVPTLPTAMKESTEINERVAETDFEKTGQWYDDETELAKLPTLIPSKEFVEAALEEAERDREEAKGTPRKRRPRPEVNPIRGFSISEAASKLLALKGLPERQEDDSDAISSGAIPGGDAVISGVAPAPGGLSSAYKPSPPQNVNYLYSRGEKEVAPASENGSDHIEDPNDADYGKRATRRKTTTLRKNPTSRSNAGSTKRKKSTIPVAPVKRTRLSVDDLTHNAEDDAEGSDDQAMENTTHNRQKKP